MTRKVRVMKVASELKMGDMFVSWDLKESAVDYIDPRRILDIRSRDGGVRLHLDDLARVTLHDEQVVIVEELA